MGETWNKKEREKKKQKNRKDKEERRQERKELAKEGKSFDDMLAYVDEYGQISSTPPDPKRMVKAVKLEDIEIGVPKQRPVDPSELIRKGTVTFFNDTKGFGFIKDQQTQESIFVHANSLSEPIKENNRVSFEVQMGPKGPNAVGVKILR
ncbi:MAG: cold shock domain-containing protein [Bacteroidia bacterium]|nr:cold shock domain-containing protein [Bacteroidia bacterium]